MKVSSKSSIKCYKTDGNQNVKEMLKINILLTQSGRIDQWVTKQQNQNFLLLLCCPCRNGLVVLLTLLTPGGHSL